MKTLMYELNQSISKVISGQALTCNIARTCKIELIYKHDDHFGAMGTQQVCDQVRCQLHHPQTVTAGNTSSIATEMYSVLCQYWLIWVNSILHNIYMRKKILVALHMMYQNYRC